MSAPVPSALDHARQWSAAVATTLDEVSHQIGSAAQGLVDGWPDAHGQEWTQRLLLLHHTLRRDADAAADLGRAIDRAADATSADDAAPFYGPALGSTSARRADDHRGAAIPRLNDAARTEG